MQVLALLLLHPSYAWGLLLFPAVLAEVLAAAFFFFRSATDFQSQPALGFRRFSGYFGWHSQSTFLEGARLRAVL